MTKNKKEVIEQIYTETKEIYYKNIESMDKVDSKLAKLIGLIIAVILLFINIIEFPKTNDLKTLYIATLILLIVSVVLLYIGYRPTTYKSINPNVVINKYCNKKYKNKIKLIESLAGTYGDCLLSIKKKINLKALMLDIGIFCTGLALIFIVILKIKQGGII